uniref:Uncharacterized protein n=1 Tax=Anopheles culicifacies TaxID=139723 RepID=A0A182M3M0_9DIPT
MVPQVARLWATVLLLASLHKCDTAVASGQPSPTKSLCLSEAGAIFNAPAIQCQPLVACNKEEIMKSYHQLHENCHINATERLNLREHFLYRINYWQGDHEFLYSSIEKAHEPHQLVLDAVNLMQRRANLIPELNRKLLIYSIEAGRIEDALLLHLTLQDRWTPKQIVDAIETHPEYRVTEAVVLHLLEFARGLPLKSTRADLYKALMPVMRRHSHLSSYVTLLYAGDATALFTAPNDKKEYVADPYTIVLHSLRNQLRKLQFDYHVWIANKYPRYYTMFLTDIYFFNPEFWKTVEKRRLVEITGMLNAKGHRFQVIEQFLKFAKQYDNRDKYNLEKWLPTLALEVDKLTQLVKQTGNHKNELDRLKKIRESFKITYYDDRQMYNTYLNTIKNYGKFGKRYMPMEKNG